MITYHQLPVFFMILLLSFLFITRTEGQVKRPEIGERFEYTFQNLINYPSSRARVADFKGKVLILDFWNTGCASCIESWPKLLKLQDQFKDKIQIILVNARQDETTIRKTIARQLERKQVSMTLPIVCRDTLLGNELFPYPAVPKIAWIDREGIYRSFTNGTYLNEEIVRKIIEGQPVSMYQLPVTDDNRINHSDYERSKLIDYNRPLFVNGNGKESKYMPLVTQSVLTGKIDGLLPVLHKLHYDESGSMITLTMQGSVNSFFRVAYNNWNFEQQNTGSGLQWLQNNRVDWKVSSPEFLHKKPSGEVNFDFFYCYQLTVPVMSKQRVQKILQLDLQKYFGLNAALEKRLVKCLVLETTDTTLVKLKAQGSYTKDSGIGKFRSADHLVYFLTYGEYAQSVFPVINETGFNGPLAGFKIEQDHERFNAELQKCGLSITVQERELTMLVVKEPEGYKFPEELDYSDRIDKLIWR